MLWHSGGIKMEFTVGEHGEKENWYILASTTVAGITYLLVSDSEDDETATQARIIRELPSESGDDTLYEDVVDEAELDAVAGVFEELLQDETD